jgi:histidine triad (HIT) family protein
MAAAARAKPSRGACVFCAVVAGTAAAWKVHEDADTLAFLDHRPLFPGHVLLVPRRHVETLGDLPDALVAPLFGVARLLAGAVEIAMEAEGSFVALNNRVSQSVPHLHVHVVPRRRGDGLRGFFWPRMRYAGEAQIRDVQGRITAALAAAGSGAGAAREL